MAVVEGIVMMHHGSHERGDNGPVIVWLMDQLPNCIEDAVCRLDVILGNGQLEVAHLSVES